MTPYDYVSPNFERLDPWPRFPNALPGNERCCGREDAIDPHRWYYDSRLGPTGFVNIDEAHLLHQWALQFEGKPALEIGCYAGFSSWFLLKAGLQLTLCDPGLSTPEMRNVVSDALQGFRPRMFGIPSPQGIIELGFQITEPWSFVFIDGAHQRPYPLLDAAAVQYLCAPDAAIVFHDAIGQGVLEAVLFLRSFGWSVRFYQTSMIVAACWRGNVHPVDHIPDPVIADLPRQDHLWEFLPDGGAKAKKAKAA